MNLFIDNIQNSANINAFTQSNVTYCTLCIINKPPTKDRQPRFTWTYFILNYIISSEVDLFYLVSFIYRLHDRARRTEAELLNFTPIARGRESLGGKIVCRSWNDFRLGESRRRVSLGDGKSYCDFQMKILYRRQAEDRRRNEEIIISRANWVGPKMARKWNVPLFSADKMTRLLFNSYAGAVCSLRCR